MTRIPRAALLGAALLALVSAASAQYTPWLYWTLLPRDQVDEIVGEASGESAWDVIAQINAYNRARTPDEYKGRFFETQVILNHLKDYGLTAEVATYPGGPAWRPVKGELWEISPGRRKLASIRDLLPALAAGSAIGDVTAELVWVGGGSAKEITDAKVQGKIAVTDGFLMMAYMEAVRQGAVGVIAVTDPRVDVDPLELGWSGISFRAMGMMMGEGAAPRRDGAAPPAKPDAKAAAGQAAQAPPVQQAAQGQAAQGQAVQGQAAQGQAAQQQAGAGQPPAGQPSPREQMRQMMAQAASLPPKFAFQLNAREGAILKARLMGREAIKVRAQVESASETADLEDVIAVIPGSDPAAGEVILSAHLFEGFNKQGANDNVSGSAGILETARILNTLISEGRLPKPRRSIRFIWGPEFSGIGQWVKANQPIMEKTLCDINMDMIGEWLSKNGSAFCLMRTTYGNPHYINDVMENYYRFLGEGSRERIQNRGGAIKVPYRVVAPTGAEETFAYSIETHYGASDHEVFNDWGVGVPGVMMIAWPDRWYHTSADTADKSDPTQLKRAAAIAAAGAYTVASADASLASRIAGETASNAVRRMGHQLAVALDAVNRAKAEDLPGELKFARGLIDAAVINERDTLDSVRELSPADKELQAQIAQGRRMVEAVGAAQLGVVQAQADAAARRLGRAPVLPVLTEAEKKAARIVPRPTAKVRQNGYTEYRKLIDAVPAEQKVKYPFRGRDLIVSDTNELALLVDGRHSALDILKMLDAQSERRSTLQAVLNYLQLLKLAGLVEM